ncbi:PucR family transcriptional regulator [Brevibacillus migulae]|uniref:PucR family transcriptional regulator n=1 Tax=Brevibacillus migulae TaxID=1644114 RepID=UPI00106E06DA|nr:PucR family transcriptional regulator [Brevibacillus migulae]
MGITIREALQLPDMVQTRLVAGEKGLDNVIRWVTIVEVLEDASRLTEGEFLITTGFGLEQDPDRIHRFIPSLAERRLSGVALHTGFYLRDIPAVLLQAADEYQLPLVQIPVEMNFSTITKAILTPIMNRQFETLAYSQAIHQRLITAALDQGGLPSILGELEKLTGGQAAIQDSLGHRLQTEHLHAMKQQKDMTKEVPIRAHRETYGTLLLTKPVLQWQELDEVAMQHAATLCALEYVKERAVSATEWRLRGDLADEILRGQIANDSELETRSRMLGYPLGGGHFIAALCAEKVEDDHLPGIHQKMNLLLKRLADLRGIRYLQRERANHLFVILPDEKRSLELLQELSRQWHKLASEPSLRISYSLPRKHLADLASAAEEALFALQAYPLLTNSPSVLSYAQLQGYQLLFPYHQEPDRLEQLWRPLLEPLLAYDRKTGQQLLETLTVYFAQSMNGLKTSQALFIHRHTLKYRLQQIEAKTGCSLEDAAACWQLQLALMALRLQRVLYPELLPDRT